jgi:diguanylate cyclase (GGDEF)-like protein
MAQHASQSHGDFEADYRQLIWKGIAPVRPAWIFVFTIASLVMSIRTQGLAALLWCYPAAILFHFVLPRSTANALNVALLLLMGPLAYHYVEPAITIPFASSLVAVLLFNNLVSSIVDSVQRSLHALTIVDALTGAYNRRHFDARIREMMATHDRTGRAAALVILDVDHFKSINDRCGHHAGDAVLIGVVARLKERLRTHDLVFRTGGEEFAVLLPDSSPCAAMEVAEALRARIESSPLLPERRVTVSAGVAVRCRHESAANWTRRCDRALYAAKQAGRNGVHAAVACGIPSPLEQEITMTTNTPDTHRSNRSKRVRRLLRAGGVILLAVAASACDQDSDTSISPTTPTTTTTTSTTPPATSSTTQAMYAQFGNGVTVVFEGGTVVINTTNTPDHNSPYWGAGHARYEAPHAGMAPNPHRIVAQRLTFRIPTSPATAAAPSDTPLGPIGVSVNGVVFFNQYAAMRQPLTFEIVSFDRFNGHPSPSNQYHYHFEPLSLTESNRGRLIGVLLDGFPVYGPTDSDGRTPADLDACNGHTAATPEFTTGIYHYHTTTAVPYISGCFRGTPGTVQ